MPFACIDALGPPEGEIRFAPTLDPALLRKNVRVPYATGGDNL
jgi:hypothetical protein